jgi:hypothetical protein
MNMASLSKIEAGFFTSKAADAGTDGNVYVGICGREFCCNTTSEDFERGQKRTYQFGSGANVTDPTMNDPRDPQLQVEDADLFPVYIRFDQGRASHWKLAAVEVVLNDGAAVFSNNAIPELWMGLRAGAFCYLRKTVRR